MEETIFLHDSHQSLFRNPFGAVEVNIEITLRFLIKGSQPQEVLLLIWNEKELPQQYVMKKQEEIKETIIYEKKLTVPSYAGLLWYYFVIKKDEKIFYYGNNQEKLGGIGKVYMQNPIPYQITVYQAGVDIPYWFRESVIYQIFPDRFYNGEERGLVHQCKKNSFIYGHWEDTPMYIKDAEGKVIRWDFFGGNLLGIIKKLSYLKDLGITAIYLNPIFASPSNHRYDTSDYKKIDIMLGNEEIFQLLCQKAKELGIYIILDGVFSHTGSDSIYFNKEGSYSTLGAYQSKDSPYYPWYKFYSYPEKYECWWGFENMPNVNELEPSYMDYIIYNEDSVLKYWMRLGVKGWRLDVVDELPSLFVEAFKETMQQKDKESVLIGEVWEDASNKVSYQERRNYLLGKQLDSVMNYPLRKIWIDFILEKITAEEALLRIMSLYENYPLPYFYSTMNLIGSHDVERILTILGEASEGGKLKEEEKRNYRLSEEKRKLAVARMKIMVLLQMTFPGVPSIYYGDEAGMEGHRDPYNRGAYPWGREDKELLEWHKEMIHLRRCHGSLSTGKWIPFLAQGDLFSYFRTIEDNKDVFGMKKTNQTLLVLVNRSSEKDLLVDIEAEKWGIKKLVEWKGKTNLPTEENYFKIPLSPLEGKIFFCN